MSSKGTAEFDLHPDELGPEGAVHIESDHHLRRLDSGIRHVPFSHRHFETNEISQGRINTYFYLGALVGTIAGVFLGVGLERIKNRMTRSLK